MIAELEAKIRQHWKQHGQPNAAITSFRRALAKTTIQLPKGQAAHGLRHTFASHFIQNGGRDVAVSLLGFVYEGRL